jgi:tetratricopeptide (TPR) repeat protein
MFFVCRELLNKTTENRKKFKIGDREEMAQAMEDFDASLALTTGIGSSKINKQVKKKLMAGETRLPPEVKQRLGIANALYIKHDYGAAINLLQEIITDFPNAHQAWNTLGLVHEEMGNPSKSMQLRMMAAHMCQENSLWKELGQKSV